MKNWEYGHAWVERGKIKPSSGRTKLVNFDPTAFDVVTGPVKFQRSDKDKDWADVVINIFNENHLE